MKKSPRGRRAGQLGKAHKSVREEINTAWKKLTPSEQERLIASGITPEIQEAWQHAGLATVGNFPKEVQYAAFNLGKLVREYKTVLSENRSYLEMNRRRVEIPLPYLPQGEHFNESELAQCIHGTGHDVIWVMQHLGYIDAFRLLSYMIQAAAKNDTNFFKEFHRRVCCGVPLESPAEPIYSAMTSLKECYYKERWDYARSYYERVLPSLLPVMTLPPAKRPPLHLAQIAEYVHMFSGAKGSHRALSRIAKIIGIPIAKRGQRQNGT